MGLRRTVVRWILLPLLDEFGSCDLEYEILNLEPPSLQEVWPLLLPHVGVEVQLSHQVI